MSHERNIDYLHKRRIVYRRNPINDKPTHRFEWGDFYEDGTYECYTLFRSKAKITTYKSLKWHLLVLWYLNPQLDQDDFDDIARFLCHKENGFITFSVIPSVLNNIIHEVSMFDLDEPPKNKLRKIIFNEFCGLSLEEKMKIVGQMIGKSKKVNQDDIYECMIDLNDTGQKITISRIANLLNCSPRTVYRTMGNELKKEKELLNKQI